MRGPRSWIHRETQPSRGHDSERAAALPARFRTPPETSRSASQFLAAELGARWACLDMQQQVDRGIEAASWAAVNRRDLCLQGALHGRGGLLHGKHPPLRLGLARQGWRAPAVSGGGRPTLPVCAVSLPRCVPCNWHHLLVLNAAVPTCLWVPVSLLPGSPFRAPLR